MTASSRAAWLALFVVAFGANVPVPLLLVYREDLALSSATVTLVFGVYAAGVIPALLLAGPASDRYGRLRLVLPFTGLAAVASVVFVAADGVEAALFVGRFLQGVAVLLPACVLLGASYGLCLAAGLARAQTMADPAMRAALTATFYAVAYAGMAAPFVIIEASAALGQTTTLAAAAALALASAVWIGVRSGRASAPHGLAARILLPSHATQQRRKPWS